MSEHKTAKASEAIVTSDNVLRRSGHGRLFHRPRRRYTYIFVGLLIVLLGVVAYELLKPDQIVPPAAADIKGLQDYAEMTPAQADQFLYQKTGLTVEYLSKKDINGHTLKTFTVADNAAQALAQFGKKQKALQAYAVANAKSPKYDYAFHERYATTALQAGDKNTWQTQMQLAQTAVTQKPGLSDSSREVLRESIRSTMYAVESGN